MATENLGPSFCPFCEIARRRAPAEIVRTWVDGESAYEVMAFRPLNPVAPGHLLVVPFLHVTDAVDQPRITGAVFQRAAQLAQETGDCNLITSVGMLATQSVRHLHVHIVPRSQDDGLMLPWGDNARQSREYRDNALAFYGGGA